MTDIQAAIGREQLKRLPEIIKRRRESQEPCYSDAQTGPPLAESERARERCILLPLDHQMTDEEQGHVCEFLEEACQSR